MIDQWCLGPGVDPSRISPDAEITGASYLTGPETVVAGGVVIRDSRIHNVSVEAGAAIVDSIVKAEGEARSHRCDTAGRTVVSGAHRLCVACDARVHGSTLINTSVGAGSRVVDTWAEDCQFGAGNAITEAKIILTQTGQKVTVTGPTELSEAYVGDHATIDRRGYFEGIFSNSFYDLEFNPSRGVLEVVDTIDLPHVSRYGVNTINSTNSGKLLGQRDGVVHGFGRHVGLWYDELLSHEQVELGPCCCVAPWTKVIGQSPSPHHDDEQLVNDEWTTYVMPFGIVGVDGEMTQGLVMPGELSTGLGSKRRRGAWLFTYAPDAVIRMVARLHEALPADRKDVADTIVVRALRTAVEMTKAIAARNDVDLAGAKPRRGWGKWVFDTMALLRVHVDADLWRFQDGRPVEWRVDQTSGTWTHPRIDQLLAVAPDATDQQVSESQIFACDDPIAPASVAVSTNALDSSGGEPVIDRSASVAPGAVIGPGSRIGPGCVVAAGAEVYNSVLTDTTVGRAACIERSELVGSTVGDETLIRSSRMTGSQIGVRSSVQSAVIDQSTLADQTTVSAFGDIVRTATRYGTILGGRCHDTEIDTYLMSMHMAGTCEHLKSIPTPVEIDGRVISVPAMPMLGGGSAIRGREDSPVTMECCFIGSNAVIEAGTFVGFGCFVLGTLATGSGLLPFTLSTDARPARHQIGAVLTSMPSTIITHFVNWTFQAVGVEMADAVGQMVAQSIRRGIDAVEWEGRRRRGDSTPCPPDAASYTTMAAYSDDQLEAGLFTYRQVLDSNAWDIVVRDGQLWFASKTGQWRDRGGPAHWQKL